MATLTPQDIQALIEAAVKGALEGQQKVRRDGGSLDERYFRRVEQIRWKGRHMERVELPVQDAGGGCEQNGQGQT